MNWRTIARRALLHYPALLKKREEKKAWLTPLEDDMLDAVDFVIRMQRIYSNGSARLKMLRLVYFDQSHTLEGAALACHYSRSAVMQWESEILSAVYTAMLMKGESS